MICRKFEVFILGILFSFTALAGQGYAQTTQDSSYLVAVVGDSVTRGTMADVQLGAPDPRFPLALLWGQLNVFFNNFKYRAIGKKPPSEDDLRFFEMNFNHMSRLPLSAFVGSQDYSIPTKLRQYLGETPEVYNGAMLAAGYTSSKLILDRLEAFLEKDHRRPNLVIVNFNGMDFIGGFKLSDFRQAVKVFFDRLTALAPDSKIFVTGLNDPTPILTAEDRIAVPKSPLTPEMSCHQIYKQLRFGQNVGLGPDSSAEDIMRAQEKLTIMRKVHEELIDAANQKEGFAGEIFYLPAENIDIDPVAFLSADCIHPNIQGQRIFGESLWDFMETRI